MRDTARGIRTLEWQSWTPHKKEKRPDFLFEAGSLV